mgnify:CR=1 FL=1
MTSALFETNKKYWTDRAPSYSQVNQEELAGSQRKNWLREISRQIQAVYPHRLPQEISVLDVGTGPGFFAVILAEAGYRVTAIDAAPAMLAEAKRNAGRWQETIDFRLMDAQKPAFAAESFDVVLSRNLTWVLDEPEQTYCNWRHVLKSGGLLLNFDANWYNYLHDDKLKQQYEQDRLNVRQNNLEDHYLSTDIDAMEAIALQVPLTGIQRPHWDIGTLNKLRMRSVITDSSVWQRVWSPIEKINYASTPMFMIAAIK